jgi:hypothetical protein
MPVPSKPNEKIHLKFSTLKLNHDQISFKGRGFLYRLWNPLNENLTLFPHGQNWQGISTYSPFAEMRQ